MNRANSTTLDAKCGMRGPPLLLDLCHDVNGLALRIIEAFLNESIGLPF
jgi:hypothetical protein